METTLLLTTMPIETTTETTTASTETTAETTTASTGPTTVSAETTTETTTLSTETTTETSTETTTSTSTSTTETTTAEAIDTTGATTRKEPGNSKWTTITTTSTTMSTTSIFTSTEMPADEDHGKLPQGDQPRCEKIVKADIIFGMHGISGRDKGSVSEFIQAMGSGFDLKSGNFKLGLKENCKKLLLNPTEFGDMEDFKYAVRDVMEKDLTPLLLHFRRAFGLSGRRADRIAIILLSGKVQDMAKAYRAASRLKNKVKVIVVGVGKDIDTEQLKGLASYRDKSEPDISHVFPVTEPSNLPYIVKKLNRLLCIDQ